MTDDEITLPQKVKVYRPFRNGKMKKRHKVNMRYELSDGPIDVIRWFRWPSYDFIFGVPSKSNKFHGEETGFFQYRDIRIKKVIHGFYVDRGELDALIEGFSAIKENKA